MPMTRDPESIMDAERQDALHQEARDSERRELPDYDRPPRGRSSVRPAARTDPGGAHVDPVRVR